ncbi:MAG: polymer-forming cytoskeletal protein [Hyphomicrobiaceae bacterium]|nr:polymer-forming cytoskeletal protein [Hyphomicrobiaceae bacterium]
MSAVVIGEEVTITGNIITSGPIQVEGNVQGHIFGSEVIISKGGQVSGGIVAEKVTVYGSVSGSINALSIILEPGSHTEADLCHRELTLELHSYFEGKSRQSENPLSRTMLRLETFRQATAAADTGKWKLIEAKHAA